MFGLIYFESDNTLSVVKRSHRDLTCTEFVRKASCIMRWSHEEYVGIIIKVGEKEAELKKESKALVSLLQDFPQDPISELLNATAQVDPIPKQAAATDVSTHVKTSLLDTWKLINAPEKDQLDNSYIEIGAMPAAVATMPAAAATMPAAASTMPAAVATMPAAVATMPAASAVVTMPAVAATMPAAAATMPTAVATMPAAAVTMPAVAVTMPAAAATMPAAAATMYGYPYQQTFMQQLQQQPIHLPYHTVNMSQQLFSLLKDLASPQVQQELTQIVSSHQEEHSAANYGETIEHQNYYQQEPQPQQEVRRTPRKSPRKHFTSSTPLRRTPRKTPRKHFISSTSPETEKIPRTSSKSDMQSSSATKSEMVHLVEGNSTQINRHHLRKYGNAALRNGDPGFYLMGKLVPAIIPRETMARSKGQGLGGSKADDLRPVLDPEVIRACKDYVRMWCREHAVLVPDDSALNKAITRQVDYSRKEMKKALT